MLSRDMEDAQRSKIGLPEIKPTLSEINSRSKGWKISELDKNHKCVHLRSGASPEHKKYEENDNKAYYEIVQNS